MPIPPQTCLATDPIERLRDGLRCTLVTFIDPTRRLAFAFAATLSLLPKPLKVVPCDNGSKFETALAQILTQPN